MASEPQRRILDAALVAIAEHGLVPSVVAARMTFAAGPEALQGAVAAGVLGCGSVILGSSQAANGRTPSGATPNTVLGPFHIDASPVLALGATLPGGLPGEPLY